MPHKTIQVVIEITLDDERTLKMSAHDDIEKILCSMTGSSFPMEHVGRLMEIITEIKSFNHSTYEERFK